MKNYNRTIKFGPGSQPEFYSKKTTSGLWTICVSNGLNKHFVYLNKYILTLFQLGVKTLPARQSAIFHKKNISQMTRIPPVLFLVR